MCLTKFVFLIRALNIRNHNNFDMKIKTIRKWNEINFSKLLTKLFKANLYTTNVIKMSYWVLKLSLPDHTNNCYIMRVWLPSTFRVNHMSTFSLSKAAARVPKQYCITIFSSYIMYKTHAFANCTKYSM